jgi:hypothetical protein
MLNKSILLLTVLVFVGNAYGQIKLDSAYSLLRDTNHFYELSCISIKDSTYWVHKTDTIKNVLSAFYLDENNNIKYLNTRYIVSKYILQKHTASFFYSNCGNKTKNCILYDDKHHRRVFAYYITKEYDCDSGTFHFLTVITK